MNKEYIRVVNLSENLDYLEEVSKWIWKEWSEIHGASLGDVVYRSRHSICKSSIPQMYIALYDKEVIGVVSLWNNDLTARQDLTPWMATLFVKEEYRGLGVGTILQEKSIEVAKSLNYEYLYLITDHVGYYERTGWEFLEQAPLGDGRMTHVYQYNLKSNHS